MAHPAPERPRHPVLTVPLLASLVCAALVAGRALYTGRLSMGYFCWNLLLAWIPLGLSLALARRHAPGRSAGRPGTWALGAAWLVFFPNAPYLVTDLVHLRARSPVPLWFDALTMSAFALTGLFVGFVSLLQLHGLVERAHGPRAGWHFVGAISVLTGVGIYLGRFHRWNSWDLVTRPGQLLEDAASWVLDPLANARGAAVAAIFGGLFGASYLVLFTLSRIRVRHLDQSVPASVGQSD
jgi:uncharacterized membrane protein